MSASGNKFFRKAYELGENRTHDHFIQFFICCHYYLKKWPSPMVERSNGFDVHKELV